MDTSIYIMLKGREYPAPKPFIWIPLYTLCPEKSENISSRDYVQKIWKYLVQRLCPEKSENIPSRDYVQKNLKGREYPAPKPFIWIPLYTFMLYTKISRPETMSEFRVGDYVSDFIYKIIYKKYFLCDWQSDGQSHFKEVLRTSKN